MIAPTTKLFEKKTKIVEVSETATWLKFFGIATGGRFFHQPRRVLVASNGSGTVKPHARSYDCSVPSQNGEVALFYCVVDNSRMLSET